MLHIFKGFAFCFLRRTDRRADIQAHQIGHVFRSGREAAFVLGKADRIEYELILQRPFKIAGYIFIVDAADRVG